jgi:hypothetical protein
MFENPDVCLAKISDELKIDNFFWAKECFKLFTATSQQLKISLYDLPNSEVGVLLDIKMVSDGFDCSDDGKLFTTLQMTPSGKECIEVFNVIGSYSLGAFEIDTKNACKIKFGHLNLSVFVLDKFLANDLLVYSLNGELIETIPSEFPVVVFKVSRTKLYFAIGRSNGSLALYNGISFNRMFEVPLQKLFEPSNYSIVFEEAEVFEHFNIEKIGSSCKSTLRRFQCHFQTPLQNLIGFV